MTKTKAQTRMRPRRLSSSRAHLQKSVLAPSKREPLLWLASPMQVQFGSVKPLSAHTPRMPKTCGLLKSMKISLPPEGPQHRLSPRSLALWSTRGTPDARPATLLITLGANTQLAHGAQASGEPVLHFHCDIAPTSMKSLWCTSNVLEDLYLQCWREWWGRYCPREQHRA